MSEIEDYKRRSKWGVIIWAAGILVVLLSYFWYIKNEETLVEEKEELVVEKKELETSVIGLNDEKFQLNKELSELKFENDTLTRIISSIPNPVPAIIVKRTGYSEIRNLVFDYVRFWNSRQKDSVVGLFASETERFYGMRSPSPAQLESDLEKRWTEHPDSYYKPEKSSIVIELLNDNNYEVTLKSTWVDTEADVETTMKINDELKLFFIRGKALN